MAEHLGRGALCYDLKMTQRKELLGCSRLARFLHSKAPLGQGGLRCRRWLAFFRVVSVRFPLGHGESEGAAVWCDRRRGRDEKHLHLPCVLNARLKRGSWWQPVHWACPFFRCFDF